MNTHYLFYKSYLCLCVLILSAVLVSCSSTQKSLPAIKNDSGFIERKIEAAPFLLTSYEHIKAQDGIAHIYIEGDGLAWLNKRTPSLDPTPRNPVAFDLAKLDKSDNVIYLARPCQYSKLIMKRACPSKYWTSHRFAPEVLAAMDEALNDIKSRHNITKFHLIGFSGGGNVAALLTARRDDILSLRTVAGNLDHATQSDIHKVSQMPSSLNAKDIALQINHIPQIHFIGGKDKIVPVPIYESYKRASGNTNCVQPHIVENVSHSKGWQDVWLALLAQPFSCH